MAEFDEAYYKINNTNIEINQYVKEIHYTNLYCPECFKAPIHIVNKQKTTYFASNRKKEHSKDCQHYEEFINHRKLEKLVNSSELEDKNRLLFLIENNLISALNLLIKNHSTSLLNDTTNLDKVDSDLKITTPSNTYKKESIPRVHITNLNKKKTELNNQLIIVYGIANVKTTPSNFNSKRIDFKLNEKTQFSVFLSQIKLEYYKNPSSETNEIGFALFGKLVKKGVFLNIEIPFGQHISYLP